MARSDKPMPTKGRVVFYTDRNHDECVAIVVKVIDAGTIHLCVFPPDGDPNHYAPYLARNVTTDEWNWPPRA